MPILSGTTRRKLNNAVSPDTLVTILGIVNENPYETVHIGDTISDANGQWSLDTGLNEGPFIQIQWKKEGNQILPAICNPYITSSLAPEIIGASLWIDSYVSGFNLTNIDSVDYINSVSSISPATLQAVQTTEEIRPRLINQLIDFIPYNGGIYTSLVVPELTAAFNSTVDGYTISFNIPNYTHTTQVQRFLANRDGTVSFIIFCSVNTLAIRDLGATLHSVDINTYTTLSVTVTVNRAESAYRVLINDNAPVTGVPPTTGTSGSNFFIGGTSADRYIYSPLRKVVFAPNAVSDEDLLNLHNYIKE